MENEEEDPPVLSKEEKYQKVSCSELMISFNLIRSLSLSLVQSYIMASEVAAAGKTSYSVTVAQTERMEYRSPFSIYVYCFTGWTFD